MFRALLRLVLIVVLLVGVAGFLLGWWTFRGLSDEVRETVGTTGTATGNELGDKAAQAASQAGAALENGAITAKIKSKMALDDHLEALQIDVDTSRGVVTLTGTVDSEAQRERALRLARETDGVRQVVDHLTVRKK